MLRGLVHEAYRKAQENVVDDRPNLIILRGFSELIHSFPVPEEWEHWTLADIYEDGVYYLLAEEFQVLMMDEFLYHKVLVNQQENGPVSFGNILDDENLAMELFTAGLIYSDKYFSKPPLSPVVESMYGRDFNFLCIDFNLFDNSESQLGEEYFPVNYAITVGNDYEYFDDLDYYGYLKPDYHGQGLVQYYDFTFLLDMEPIEVFDKQPSYQSLGFELGDEEISLFEKVSLLSNLFFEYLEKVHLFN